MKVCNRSSLCQVKKIKMTFQLQFRTLTPTLVASTWTSSFWGMRLKTLTNRELWVPYQTWKKLLWTWQKKIKTWIKVRTLLLLEKSLTRSSQDQLLNLRRFRILTERGYRIAKKTRMLQIHKILINRLLNRRIRVSLVTIILTPQTGSSHTVTINFLINQKVLLLTMRGILIKKWFHPFCRMMPRWKNMRLQ